MSGDVKFRLKNNTERSIGLAGRLCIAGSGNPTPPEAQKQIIDGQPFRLPPAFEMTEAEMFKSFRGVLPHMKQLTRGGRAEIEVFIDGVPHPLEVKDIEGWADDYRGRHNLPRPQSSDDHAREAEKAMNRREDPIERQRRLEKEQERTDLVKSVTAAVLAVLKPELSQAPTPEAAPPAPPARGRNDEAPELAPAPPPQRARPRTEEK